MSIIEKLLSWYYRNKKLFIRCKPLCISWYYRQWIDPAIMYIDINKPEKYLSDDEKLLIETVTKHSTEIGYCVIVRD